MEINSFVKLNKFAKKTKTFDLIGCDPISLKDFLEKKFIEGMCWGNYGEWHIDHIIPLSSAKTEEEIYKLCHYSNLQPLWAIDNLKKVSYITSLNKQLHDKNNYIAILESQLNKYKNNKIINNTDDLNILPTKNKKKQNKTNNMSCNTRGFC